MGRTPDCGRLGGWRLDPGWILLVIRAVSLTELQFPSSPILVYTVVTLRRPSLRPALSTPPEKWKAGSIRLLSPLAPHRLGPFPLCRWPLSGTCGAAQRTQVPAGRRTRRLVPCGPIDNPTFFPSPVRTVTNFSPLLRAVHPR